MQGVGFSWFGVGFCIDCQAAMWEQDTAKLTQPQVIRNFMARVGPRGLFRVEVFDVTTVSRDALPKIFLCPPPHTHIFALNPHLHELDKG